MSLCDICVLSPAYCRERTVRLTTDAELDSDAFRFGVRVLLVKLKVPPFRMLDFLSDCFRDAACAKIVNNRGERIELDFEMLEFDNFPFWIRGLRQLPPPSVSTRLKAEKREAFRVLATLLRVIFPAETFTWGLVAANDNEPADLDDEVPF